MPIYDRSRETGFIPGRHQRWQVRWRDGDARQRKKSFDGKAAAIAFEDDLRRHRTLRNQTRTVAEQWELWRASRRGTSAGHRANLATQWELHIEPTWGHRRVSGLQHSEISAWVGDLVATRSPSLARKCLVQLASIIDQAVRDGVIEANPATGVDVKVTKQHESVYLTRDQLDAVATAMGPDRLVVLTLGLTGIRWGEMAGLRNSDLDLERRRITVQRTITEVGGRLAVKQGTKNRGVREVTGPAWLLNELAESRAGGPRDPLLPAARGGVRRHSRFGPRWRKLVQGPPPDGLGIAMRVHDLRHTAASLMIASGADPKTVQRQLGHKSATMTMDLYSHLWDSALDDLADRMT